MNAEVLRFVLRRRRLVVATLLALVVLTALPTFAPAAPPTTTVLAASRDLDAGQVLTAGDLAAVDLPVAVVPDGTLHDGAVGQVLAGAVRRGEPLTDRRLVGPGLVSGLADGLVATPVRVADPAAAALLSAGDRVDVLAAAPEGPPGAETVAAAVRVLAVPSAVESSEGALVVLATSPAVASRLAGVAVSSRLSVVVRPG